MFTSSFAPIKGVNVVVSQGEPLAQLSLVHDPSLARLVRQQRPYRYNKYEGRQEQSPWCDSQSPTLNTHGESL
jgi:hypothetical protein